MCNLGRNSIRSSLLSVLNKVCEVCTRLPNKTIYQAHSFTITLESQRKAIHSPPSVHSSIPTVVISLHLPVSRTTGIPGLRLIGLALSPFHELQTGRGLKKKKRKKKVLQRIPTFLQPEIPD